MPHHSIPRLTRLGPGLFTTLRTAEDNWHGQPVGGLGMWLLPEDIARLSFLLTAGGAANGQQFFTPACSPAPSSKTPPTGV